MQINATFLFQIVNFWISYVVLHKYLFKPMVQLITQKEAAKAFLKDGLKQKEAMLLHLQEDKKKNLEDFRFYIKSHYLFSSPRLEEIPVPSMYQKNRQEIDSLTSACRDVIIAEANDAY
jgi:hypothetical protein